MSIDDHLERQIAEYFGWLEADLGTTMRAAPPQRRPRRMLALAGAAVAVAAVVATAVVVRHDNSRTVAPAVSPTSAASSVDTTVATAVQGEPSDLAWAPSALPPTMEVVDTIETVDFQYTADLQTTRAQAFVRLAEDGADVEASLSLTVGPADDDEIAALTPNGEIHGLPAVVSAPSSTDTSAWWVEDGRVVSAVARGFGLSELLELLEPMEWRAERDEGFEPSTIGGGLRALYDSDARAPRRLTSYVIHDLGRDTYFRVTVGAPPPGLVVKVHRVATGELIESELSPFHWLLVTDDGVGVYIGYSPWTPDIDLVQATAIAEAMRLADRSTLDRLQVDGSHRLAQLPLLTTVSIGDVVVQLRGGTVDEPVALCVDDSDGSGCSYNDIDRDGNPLADGITQTLLVGDQWIVLGYGLLSLHSVDGQTAVEYPWRFCSADVDGSLVGLLPDERGSLGDREYFAVPVPASVDSVRMCVDANGELRPAGWWAFVRDA